MGADETPPTTAPALDVLRLLEAYRASVPVYVATKLGLADLLRDGPRTSAELAEATGTHEPSLHRLLLALCTLGLFSERAERGFAVTAQGVQLQRGGPMWGLALLLGGEHYRVWGEMLRSVTTGGPAFAEVYGMPLPQYLAQTPATAEAFDESMTGLTAQTVAATLAAYDFSQASRVVDVGGGHGALAMAILEAHPAASALVLELPHVAERAAQRIGAAGLAGRCSAVAGDFREAVPAGADLYILSRVLQGLDDPAAAALLTRCAAGLTDDGRLLMAEMVTANGNERVTRLEDLHMLVVTPGGRIRSVAEHAALFARAGLEVARVLHTRTLVPFSLIEGVRAVAVVRP